MSFDDVVSKLAGSTTGEGGRGLVASVLELLSNRQGGISGLVESFQQNGLGHVVSSWVGTGGNLPVTGEQVQEVLGTEFYRQFFTNTNYGYGAAIAIVLFIAISPVLVYNLRQLGQQEGF